MKIRVALWFVVLLLAVLGSAENFHTGDVAALNQTFFISEIFDKYGNNNLMTYEGFEHLLENLGLGKLKFETQHDVSIHKVNGTFREFHDELSLHKHNHRRKAEDEAARRKRYLNAKGVTDSTGGLQTTPNDDFGLPDVRSPRGPVEKAFGRKCLTAQDILATYGLGPYHEVVISPSTYLQICPAIVYELDQKLCQGEEAKAAGRGEEERHLVWIYASSSVLAMGISGMLCVLAVPLFRKGRHSPFLQFLASLAAGTLCGDALIHLIPQVFLTPEKESSTALLVSRGTVTLFAIYFFFIIENIIKGTRDKKKKNAKEGTELGEMLPTLHGHCHGESDEVKTVAWMAILGDVLHNVTDGLSIGAAFATSLSSGFASSIAIFCHELPHELGDYAILLASGMSVKKSLFYNVVSSAFSFFGMVAGILLGGIEDASLWINAFTAGSFLYIALSDLVPEMRGMQMKFDYKSPVLQSFGLACGGILMLAIALYEDQIESLLR